MSAARRTRLIDCNPRWVTGRYHGDGLGCEHVIPFTPALDGSARTTWQQNGAIWQRTGDTFETLTLSPSIRRNPTYASREAAIAAGALPEYLNDSHFCAFHGFIRDGQIEFCGDSR